MKVKITKEAAAYLQSKGGEIILFERRLTGCIAGNVPSPMWEIGKPRRPIGDYDILLVSGIRVYLDKDLSSYQGAAEFTTVKTLWRKELSFSYHS